MTQMPVDAMSFLYEFQPTLRFPEDVSADTFYFYTVELMRECYVSDTIRGIPD